ncbi:hypothetical protein ABG768_007102, partial [Culter alburnus]
MADSQGSRDGDFSPGCSSVQQKSPNPESSCVSMKSDRSMDTPEKFRSGDKPDLGSIQQKSPNPVSSCVSMKSDRSMDTPEKFRSGDKPDLGSFQQKSPNPMSSCVSLKSDRSMDSPEKFRRGNTRRKLGFEEKSSNPEFSCVSMKSDRSMDSPEKFGSGETRPDRGSFQQKSPNPVSSCVSLKSDRSMDSPEKFRRGNTRRNLGFEEKSSKPEPQPLKSGVKRPNPSFQTSSVQQKRSKPESSSEPPQSEDTQPDLSHAYKPAEVLNTLRSNLRKKFECLYEGISKQGNPTLLNEIYTELYITESESGEISNEHEVRQIETQSRRAEKEDTPIKCNDIFRPLPGQDKPIRTVLTKGVAGIGKTVSVQKFILDWAEGKENQDVHLIFPLPFRELNLLKGKTLSLSDFLHVFFPETKE